MLMLATRARRWHAAAGAFLPSSRRLRPPCVRALCTAGCGLPPGPSGLLGAAEGVSYLVVGSIALWSLARKLSTGNGELLAAPTAGSAAAGSRLLPPPCHQAALLPSASPQLGHAC